MKIVIIGADGQLGSDLRQVFPSQDLIPLTINDLDIADPTATRQMIARLSPAIVINTAAFHDLAKCENDAPRAFAVNALGPSNLAKACHDHQAKLIQLSTDYVFNGDKTSPYVEGDLPQPLSTYGISKLAGEHYVQANLANHLIIRTSGLFGAAGCLGKGGGNFIDNMIKRAAAQPELKVVTDEVISPTYTLDLASKIAELVISGATGLYHVANSGQCSWFELAQEIFRLLNRPIKILPVDSLTFPSPARRPKFSALRSQKLKSPLRPWPEALKAYLIEKGHLRAS